MNKFVVISVIIGLVVLLTLIGAYWQGWFSTSPEKLIKNASTEFNGPLNDKFDKLKSDINNLTYAEYENDEKDKITALKGQKLNDLTSKHTANKAELKKLNDESEADKTKATTENAEKAKKINDDFDKEIEKLRKEVDALKKKPAA